MHLIKQKYFVIIDPFPQALESVHQAPPLNMRLSTSLEEDGRGDANISNVDFHHTSPVLYSFMTHSGQELSSNLQTVYL